MIDPESTGKLVVHRGLLERLYAHDGPALALGVGEDGPRRLAVLFLKLPEGYESQDLGPQSILATHLLSAPTCDLLYVAITLQEGLPFNVLLDPASTVSRTLATLLAEDGQGCLVIVPAATAVHEPSVAAVEFPEHWQSAAQELGHNVLRARKTSSGFAKTALIVWSQAPPAGVSLSWVAPTFAAGLSPRRAPVALPFVGGDEAGEPRWLPLERLPLVAELIETELANDRELLDVLSRGVSGGRSISGEELRRVRAHVQEQVEFNSLHRDQIEHWRQGAVSPTESRRLDRLVIHLDQLDGVLDQTLALLSRHL